MFELCKQTKQIVEAKKKEEEKQYNDFVANLTTVFKKNPDDKSMHHVELVTSFNYYEKTKFIFCCITTILIFFLIFIQAFFPIIAHEHFYLVVFNITKGTSVIIDNSPKTYEAKYSKECDVLVSN